MDREATAQTTPRLIGRVWRLLDGRQRRRLSWVATHDSAALANSVTFEVNRLATGLIAGLLTLISAAFAAVLIAVAVLIINPLAGACALALFATSYAAVYVAVRGRLHRYGQTQTRLWRERATLLAESFAAIREILLLRRPDYFRDEFAEQCASIARSAWATLAIAQ